MNRLREFFYGRYGIDRLGFVLILISAILSNLRYGWIVSSGLFVYAVFRILSKNKERRYQELQLYNRIEYQVRQKLNPVARNISNWISSMSRNLIAFKSRLQQRKYYIFIKCPKCKNNLRLPKNKGKLSVTCPVCKNEFYKKT